MAKRAARAAVVTKRKLARGEPVTPEEVRGLEVATDLLGPAGVDRAGRAMDEERPEGAPEDAFATTQKGMAQLSGVHENTLGNWKRRGIEPGGGKPWSITAWFLLLRQHGLLSETKPTRKDVQEIRAWCFGNGEASDPNDPAHSPPRGWGEEQSRQGALKTKANRIKEEIELATLRRERIPLEAYRERWARRAQQVLTAIESFMSIPRDVPDLTEPQRVAMNTALRAKIRDVRQRLAPPKKGASHGRQ